MRDREAIQRCAEACGLSLSAAQVGALVTYRDELLRWNQKINLTAAREPREALLVAVLDPIVAYSRVAARLPAGPLLDVGAGGGVPSVVWKILDPARPIEAWDGVGKKIHFIRHVARLLRFQSFQGLHKRASADGEWFSGSYAVTTARALAEPPAALALLAPQTAPDGVIALLTGPRVPLEAESYALSHHDYDVPGHDRPARIWLATASRFT